MSNASNESLLKLIEIVRDLSSEVKAIAQKVPDTDPEINYIERVIDKNIEELRRYVNSSIN